MPIAVDILTRTKDRPYFLERCLSDIAAQTFRDFRWNIVNDGGDPVPVRAIAEKAAAQGISVEFHSFEQSVGMEAAANRAAELGDAPLMVVHDDDDTWAPNFLTRMVAALDGEAAIGALSWSVEVREQVDETGLVSELSRQKSEFCPTAVGIASLAMRNAFPPIAFLFRRSAFEASGKFNEELRVLGDWDFNLRLIQIGDFRVVPEFLANYHIRTQGSVGANSVVAGRNDHLAGTTDLQNHYIRKDLASGKFGLGSLMAIGAMTQETAARQSFSQRWRRLKASILKS